MDMVKYINYVKADREQNVYCVIYDRKYWYRMPFVHDANTILNTATITIAAVLMVCLQTNGGYVREYLLA